MGSYLGFLPTGTAIGSQIPSAPGSNQPIIGMTGTIAGIGVAATGAVASAVVAGTASASTEALAATVAATVPIAGAIIAAVTIIALKIFHGADPRQVPASKIVQVFVLAGRFIGAAFTHGMLTKAQAMQGLEYLRSVGHKLYEQNRPQLGDKITNQSIQNLDASFNQKEAGLNAQVDHEPSVEIDPSIADTWNINTNPYDGTSDNNTYYKESVDAARAVARQWLESLPKNFTAGQVSDIQGAFQSGDITGGLTKIEEAITSSSAFKLISILVVTVAAWAVIRRAL